MQYIFVDQFFPKHRLGNVAIMRVTRKRTRIRRWLMNMGIEDNYPGALPKTRVTKAAVRSIRCSMLAPGVNSNASLAQFAKRLLIHAPGRARNNRAFPPNKSSTMAGQMSPCLDGSSTWMLAIQNAAGMTVMMELPIIQPRTIGICHPYQAKDKATNKRSVT